MAWLQICIFPKLPFPLRTAGPGSFPRPLPRGLHFMLAHLAKLSLDIGSHLYLGCSSLHLPSSVLRLQPSRDLEPFLSVALLHCPLTSCELSFLRGTAQSLEYSTLAPPLLCQVESCWGKHCLLLPVRNNPYREGTKTVFTREGANVASGAHSAKQRPLLP